MAPPAIEGGGREQPPPAQQQRQQGGVGQMLTGIIRVAVFWYFASKFFSPKKPISSDPSVPNLQISNLFHKGEPLVRPPPLSLSLIVFLLTSIHLVVYFNCDTRLLSDNYLIGDLVV